MVGYVDLAVRDGDSVRRHLPGRGARPVPGGERGAGWRLGLQRVIRPRAGGEGQRAALVGGDLLRPERHRPGPQQRSGEVEALDPLEVLIADVQAALADDNPGRVAELPRA